MTLELLHETLGWCTAINIAVLFYWFLMFTLAKDWVYQFHRKWFQEVSKKDFEVVHYTLMGQYKLIIFIFNLSPYVALHILG